MYSYVRIFTLFIIFRLEKVLPTSLYRTIIDFVLFCLYSSYTIYVQYIYLFYLSICASIVHMYIETSNEGYNMIIYNCK